MAEYHRKNGLGSLFTSPLCDVDEVFTKNKNIELVSDDERHEKFTNGDDISCEKSSSNLKLPISSVDLESNVVMDVSDDSIIPPTPSPDSNISNSSLIKTQFSKVNSQKQNHGTPSETCCEVAMDVSRKVESLADVKNSNDVDSSMIVDNDVLSSSLIYCNGQDVVHGCSNTDEPKGSTNSITNGKDSCSEKSFRKSSLQLAKKKFKLQKAKRPESKIMCNNGGKDDSECKGLIHVEGHAEDSVLKGYGLQGITVNNVGHKENEDKNETKETFKVWHFTV